MHTWGGKKKTFQKTAKKKKKVEVERKTEMLAARNQNSVLTAANVSRASEVQTPFPAATQPPFCSGPTCRTLPLAKNARLLAKFIKVLRKKFPHQMWDIFWALV